MAEQRHTAWLTATRSFAGIALLVVAGIHYQQYHYDFYSAIPTIGPLFLLLAISATGLGVFLLAPVRSRLRLPWRLIDRLAALAGIGLGIGALAGLLVSERTPLFGFMEHGYRFVIVFAIASEAVVVVVLALFLAGSFRGAGASDRAARRGGRRRFPGVSPDGRAPAPHATGH